jgi:hypothetical protein
MDKQARMKAQAVKCGLSMRALYAYERAGVDIWDAAAVEAERVRRHGERRKSPGRPKPKPRPEEEEELEAEGVPPYEVSKARWKAMQAERIRLENEKLRGELIALETVRQDMTRIGYAVRSALLRLEAELPPVLYGLEPGGMAKSIRQAVDGIMLRLHDDTSALYAKAAAPTKGPPPTTIDNDTDTAARKTPRKKVTRGVSKRKKKS